MALRSRPDARDVKLLPLSRVGVAAPWLVIAWPDCPVICIDARLLDRITLQGQEIILAIEELEVALDVPDGSMEASNIVDKLTSYPRDLPLMRYEAYEDAMSRMIRREAANDESIETVNPHDSKGDNDSVSLRGAYLVVGTLAFKFSEVEEYAMHGANLPLPNGGRLQAAVALVVVALQRRADEGEDYELLAHRIRRYQSEH